MVELQEVGQEGGDTVVIVGIWSGLGLCIYILDKHKLAASLHVTTEDERVETWRG